ncbi:hypothetical protein ACFE04_013613 [Oxalis oulophora]
MVLQLIAIAILLIFSSLLLSNLKKKSKNLAPSPQGLPIIGHIHLLEPLLHHSFIKLSKKHGPIISLNIGTLPCLVVSSPELAKECLKTNDLSFSMRHSFSTMTHMTYDSSFAFAPLGPYWKFIKKLSTYKLLGNRTLTQFLPIRTQELKYFLQYLHQKSKSGESVNLSIELMRLTNNIISQMMWSMRSSGGDGDGEAARARAIVREVTQIFGELNLCDVIPFCKYFDFQGLRRRIADTRRRFDVLVEKIIGEREAKRGLKKEEKGSGEGGEEEEERKDFLDMMLDVLHDDNAEMEITRDHIKALILDFFTAGTDTSASAIEWALAELINHPDIMKKAQQEIEQVVGPNRLVTESDCPNLPYIQAIVKETFRLHSPIPVITRRCTQTCTVNGYTVVEGTLLFVNMWAIGRDPKYWDDPLEFKPERFLSDSKNIDLKGQHFELLPFGTGRRICLGTPLAMSETPTTLAAMIQCFDWKVVGLDGKVDDRNVVDMNERPGLTVPRKHDLVCIPVPRFTQSNIIES